MNETHTNRPLEEWEFELAWPIEVPPLKWPDPTRPPEVVFPDNGWSHF